jgi:DNA-binding transcriptional LysR family regulator
VEIRDIEIFLTLAEELHFGRTAARLHLTAARVSQSVKQQERRIGAPLFERTTRTVRLTPLGEQLRRDLAAGYRQITEAVQNAAAAGASGLSGRLTIGVMGSMSWKIEHVLDLLASRHPAVEVRFREIQPPAPLEELRAGEVDAALLWMPVTEYDLVSGPVVYSSRTVLMMHIDHPLAQRETVSVEDLGDCVVLQCTALPASMEEVYHPVRTPAGRVVRRGPVVASWHEQMSIVASGRCVCAVMDLAAEFYPRPNLVFVPMPDAVKGEWALTWRRNAETPLIRALAEASADAVPPPEQGALPVSEFPPHER